MIVKWRERVGAETVTHEFDFSGSPRIQEARWIKQRTGWSTKKFLDALDELDPDAVIALLCILSAREGRKLSWDAVDLDPVTDLELLPSEDELQKVREAEAAQRAVAEGKGSLPPVPELKIENSPGGSESGHLAKAASSTNGSPTPGSSGVDSGSTSMI